MKLARQIGKGAYAKKVFTRFDRNSMIAPLIWEWMGEISDFLGRALARPYP